MTDTPLAAPPLSPAVVLAAARESVGGLTDVLWAARPPGELLDVLRAVEVLRSTLDAVQLQVVAEADATNAAVTEGWSSTQDFVTAVTGGRKGHGRRLVALARALGGDRTSTAGALATGAISLAQAEVVVNAVDQLPGNPHLRDAAEALLLNQARVRDAGDLAKAGAHVLERLDPDGTERRDERALEREERAAHASRFLSLTEDGIGGVRLKGRGTVEDAAHLKCVLDALAAPQPTTVPGACGGTPAAARGTAEAAADPHRSCGVPDCAHDGRDPRDHGARLWDALIEAARRLAATDTLPTDHARRPRVGVTIDLAALHEGLGEGRLDTGHTLSASAVRRLACDAEVLPYVLGSKAEVLDVGRQSRLVTTGLWLALLARDQHCAFPGCSRPPAACDAHHIQHWADGGVTALDNLVLLCRTHHTVVHSTPWEVSLDPGDRRPRFHPPPPFQGAVGPIRQRPLRT